MFSPANLEVKSYLKDKKNQSVVSLRLRHLKFGNRFCYDRKRVTSIEEVYKVDTSNWGTKLIIRNEHFRGGPSPHDLKHRAGVEQLAVEA